MKKRRKLAFGHLMFLIFFIHLPIWANTGTATIVMISDPADNATPVSVDTLVMAEFSEDMDEGSIDEDTFLVKEKTIFEEISVSGLVSYNSDERKAVFTPEELHYDTKYIVTITTEVKDVNGNSLEANYEWAFTTGFANHEPLIAVSPSRNAVNVSVNTVVTATFDKDMDPASIQANQNGDPFGGDSVNTFFLSVVTEDPLFGPQNVFISGNVTYHDKVATFKPDTSLEPEKEYFATVTTGVRDTEGNPLETGYKWSFTIGIGCESTPPEIVLPTIPEENTIVSGIPFVSVIFSEEMDKSAIEAPGTFTLSASGNTVEGTVSYNDKKARFTPMESPDYGIYTAVITSDAKDLCGNALESKEWSFMLMDGPPTVILTSPDKDESEVPVNALITAIFSEEMDMSGLIAPGVFSVKTDRSDDVEGTVSYNGKTATFTPATLLDGETTYTATIITAAKDLSGTPLEEVKVWSFTTMKKLDFAVRIASPASNITVSKGSFFDFQGMVVNGSEPFAYSWDFDGNADNSDVKDPGQISFDTEGTFTVTFTVTDGDKQTDSYSLTITVGAFAEKGDVSCDGEVTLKDAIIALQICTDTFSYPISCLNKADVNGDQRIGLEEAAYVLLAISQAVSGE